MDILLPEFRLLLQTLNDRNVKYMLIGGYAVIHYGYARTTGDIDIWVEPSNENRSVLVGALLDFGVDKDSLMQLSGLDFTKHQMFFFGKRPRRIDFLTYIDSITWKEAYEQINYFELEGMKVPIIHYNHLILSKMTTGRAQDKADIEELQRINQHRKGK